MMNRIIVSICLVALLVGCAQPPAQDQQLGQTAIDSLNKQIVEFNANRNGNMRITPIVKRVSRVEHDRKLDQVTALDQDGTPFIILKKEPDGRFKGILEQPYHQLAFSGPDGSHSWGHVLAEFYLEKGLF